MKHNMQISIETQNSKSVARGRRGTQIKENQTSHQICKFHNWELEAVQQQVIQAQKSLSQSQSKLLLANDINLRS